MRQPRVKRCATKGPATPKRWHGSTRLCLDICSSGGTRRGRMKIESPRAVGIARSSAIDYVVSWAPRGSDHWRPATFSSRTFSDPISLSPARTLRTTASAIASRPIASAPTAQAAIATGAIADGPSRRGPTTVAPVTVAPVNLNPVLWREGVIRPGILRTPCLVVDGVPVVGPRSIRPWNGAGPRATRRGSLSRVKATRRPLVGALSAIRRWEHSRRAS
jgi:hypothetical protein